MEFLLFLSVIFFLTFAIGKAIEKLRIPWIFAALFLGLVLSFYNPFEAFTSSESFIFLGQLGMYFLLFIIGFELDFNKIAKQSGFIVKSSLIIILSEAVVGSFFVRVLFHLPWFIAVLVAASFATVGEAVLLPILGEFKLIKTKLGQSIIGIGVLDDILEVLTLIVASFIAGKASGYTAFNLGINLVVLIGLFSSVFILLKFRAFSGRFKFKDISSLFIVVLAILFLFISVGQLAESAALGALLAGIGIKNLMPKKNIKFIESELKALCYGFFAPIFFVGVGLDTDLSYLLKFPLVIFLIILITNLTKILSSYLVAKKKLGKRNAILLGISLTVKFSTSIVIIKLLFERNLIPLSLYSALIGATVILKFIVPLLLSHLIKKWKLSNS